MQGKIVWVAPEPKTYKSKHGTGMKKFVVIEFDGGTPPGCPADKVNEQGQVKGYLAYKTREPTVGTVADFAINVKTWDDGSQSVDFKRMQVEGGAPQSNGHAAPRSGGYTPQTQAASPQIPAMEQASFIEFWARCEVAFEIILESMTRMNPEATAGERLEAAQKILTTCAIQWQRDHGCQMPTLTAVRNYTESGAEDDDSVPF